MDFGIYPPEINSGRMYTGPGSGPMMAAAQAWGSLADELYTAAGAYQSVVSELTSGSWSGPSSTAMSAAGATYVEWLSATAAQAEETATQARAAAAGYEAAFAMTVPPAEIAANRSLLAMLVATNFLGMNTPAIATTEAQYAEMWAQDAVAMYGYAGSSAAATALTPFTSPHQNTDQSGTASQAAAVGQAMTAPAGNAQSIVSNVPQTLSAVPDALQSLSTSAQSTSLLNLLGLINNLATIFGTGPGSLSTIPDVGLGLLAIISLPYGIGGYLIGERSDKDYISAWNGEQEWPSYEPAPVLEFPATLSNLPPGTVPVSAGLSEANTVGGLSVPRGWTVAAPEIRSVAMTSPLTSLGAAAAPAAAEAGSANMFNQMGLAGMAGQAMAGPPASDTGQDSGKPVTHARLTARGPGAAGDGEAEATPAPRTVVTGVAAAIREITKLRNEGRLTEEEYMEQKKRLLAISVRHRPLG
jgi:PPE-repeat protein